MAVNRSSTNLVRFLGAELSVELNRSSLSNTFRSGRGGERSLPPDTVRLSDADLVPASINIGQYEAALAFLQKRGVSPNAVRAMAVVFVDVANRSGTSVMSFLNNVDNNVVGLLEARVYDYINQLRDPSSQLSRAPRISNKNSLISRRLTFNESDFVFVIPPFDIQWDTDPITTNNGTSIVTSPHTQPFIIQNVFMLSGDSEVEFTFDFATSTITVSVDENEVTPGTYTAVFRAEAIDIFGSTAEADLNVEITIAAF